MNRIEFASDWSKNESPRRRFHFGVREIREFDSTNLTKQISHTHKILVLEKIRIDRIEFNLRNFVHPNVACPT